MTITITAAMNGRIPATLLAPIPFQTSLRLAADAAASLGRLNAAVKAAHGWSLSLTTAYRTVAEQNALKAAGLTAVSGGYSEHGLGRAVDIGGLGGQTGTRYAQLAALAGEHGWYQPAWAINGIWKGGRQVQKPEPWHWEYDPARDTHTGTTPPPIEEDDMYSDADRARDQEILALLKEQQIRNADPRLGVPKAIAKAVLGTKVSPETGTLAETTRDARMIARRVETAVTGA